MAETERPIQFCFDPNRSNLLRDGVFGVFVTRDGAPEPKYPGLRGGSSVVAEKDWAREAPFGRCPACGSVGIEDGPSSECEVALFRCSGETCRSKINTDDGGFRIVSTSWYEMKPEEWRRREIEERASWNSTHFSEGFCISHNLV